MLLIDAERGESSNFNMIQTLANNNVLFTVNGKGEVRAVVVDCVEPRAAYSHACLRLSGADHGARRHVCQGTHHPDLHLQQRHHHRGGWFVGLVG